MNYTILRPLSPALETIISTEELRKKIGMLGLSDIPTFKNYLSASNRTNLLNDLIQKSNSFFVINDDEFLNDHLLVGLHSPIIENENNILFFLLPSVLEYEAETIESIEEMKVFLQLQTDKDAFFESFQNCLIKCKIIMLTHEKSMNDQNLN